SLALLLLALCRFSSTMVDSVDKMDATSDKHIISKRAANNLGLEELQTKSAHLYNIILAFTIALGKTEKQVSSAKSTGPLNNGVQCAYEDQNISAEITQGISGNQNFLPQMEDAYAKELGIDCTNPTTEEGKCFCVSQRPSIIYCGGKKYLSAITTKKGTCMKEALSKLGTVAPMLSLAFDFAKLMKHTEKAVMDAVFALQGDSIDKIIKQESDNMNKFFCEATHPETDKAVKELFASDFSFGFAEAALALSELGLVGAAALENACKYDNEWKATVFGECLCAEDRGFSFCFYKALGEFFKKAEFLTCDPNAKPGDLGAGSKFTPGKKPDIKAMPSMKPTKTSAPKSAATSSLLLLPLSAALLMLGH
ncbi:hypothetical protein PMAYCL1PPCAC_25104, partial [Pristionchus mayeri]